MKIRIHRLCALTLISLLSLFAFAAHAAAQGQIFSPVSHSPRLRGKTGKARNAKPADAAASYEYEVLHSFCPVGGANCTDGYEPIAGLIRDAAGNLYGTTYSGGAAGGGTVFKVDTTGNETVLYSFCSLANCTDGYELAAGLIQDAAGNLYGTTVSGGSPAASTSGAGTVFKLDPTGQETVLYSFCSVSNCADGEAPGSGLIQDAAGNLYGTTLVGGANDTAQGGGGTVFKVGATGQETVLHSFCAAGGVNCTDAGRPEAGLIQDAAGNLYGTTYSGGASGSGGVVFKVDATGLYTVLYSFCSTTSCTDGWGPLGGLVQDAAGNLYGTVSAGGAYNQGAVFKLDTAGHETVLYSFCPAPSGSNCPDGGDPAAGLIQDITGNLYGTTFWGGANGYGMMFKLAAPAQQGGTWIETLLYSFCSVGGTNCTDGRNPQAGLIQDAAGNLYGTASRGGASGAGTVFQLAPTTFTVGGTAVTVSPGATSGNTSTITLTPNGGFTGSVTLTAAITSSPTGAQGPPTLSFGATSPMNVTGTSAVTATLTIATTAPTSTDLMQPLRPGFGWYTGGTTLAFGLLLGVGVPARRRSWRTRLGQLVFVGILAGGFIACGGDGGGTIGTGNPGTTPGTYSVTVTGTSGSTTATSVVTLTVQ